MITGKNILGITDETQEPYVDIYYSDGKKLTLDENGYFITKKYQGKIVNKPEEIDKFFSGYYCGYSRNSKEEKEEFIERYQPVYIESKDEHSEAINAVYKPYREFCYKIWSDYTEYRIFITKHGLENDYQDDIRNTLILIDGCYGYYFNDNYEWHKRPAIDNFTPSQYTKLKYNPYYILTKSRRLFPYKINGKDYDPSILYKILTSYTTMDTKNSYMTKCYRNFKFFEEGESLNGLLAKYDAYVKDNTTIKQFCQSICDREERYKKNHKYYADMLSDLVRADRDVTFSIERETDNTNKKTFDFVRISLIIPTIQRMPDRMEYIKKNKRAIFNYVLNELSVQNDYLKYNVPVSFLRISQMTITSNNHLDMIFELKKI
jgi:hypothetical protein